MLKEFDVFYAIKPVEKLTNRAVIEVNDLIETYGDKVLKTDIQGRKPLLAQTRGYKEAIYILTTFLAEEKFILKLNESVKALEYVLRHLIVIKN